MPKILFVYDNKNDGYWRDGLYAALKALGGEHDITWFNLAYETRNPFYEANKHDFVLGWGAFGSKAHAVVESDQITKPTGLCIAGNAILPFNYLNIGVLFYETEWYRQFIEDHPNTVHAFGVNTQIFKAKKTTSIWDFVSVGAFADWKRHYLIKEKEGTRLVVGEIQKDNLSESTRIIGDLLMNGVMISDIVPPEKLCDIYNASKFVYIPADINGGGERALLEARACGKVVVIEGDNPKLKELLLGEVWDENYYASQLMKGIQSCVY